MLALLLFFFLTLVWFGFPASNSILDSFLICFECVPEVLWLSILADLIHRHTALCSAYKMHTIWYYFHLNAVDSLPHSFTVSRLLSLLRSPPSFPSLSPFACVTLCCFHASNYVLVQFGFDLIQLLLFFCSVFILCLCMAWCVFSTFALVRALSCSLSLHLFAPNTSERALSSAPAPNYVCSCT